MEDFKKAMANYLARAISPIMDSDEKVASEIALAILNNHEEEWELPTAEALLVDMMTDEVLKRNELSENENVKKFISIWKEKTNKQLV